MATTEGENKPLFRDITADDEVPEIMEIESYCMNCESQGMTRIFLTKIPFFKEVIVSSFTCDDCGYHNTELQPGSKIQDKGVKISVLISNPKDMNRQVVQTGTATVAIPSLDFEAPPNKGVLTTVEGIIDKAVEGLNQQQPVRRIQHPEIAEKIDEFIVKITALKTLKEPFQLVISDPSGNSFIENPHAPRPDKDLTISYFQRTKEQNELLGLGGGDDENGAQEETPGKFDSKNEVMTFQGNCSNCNSPCEINMKMIDIPHFKEVVIMACVCDSCGFRDNEVKGGGGIEPKGTKIKLKITDPTDLSRDILKSETCSFSIPELDFDTDMGTLGGKFTTIEGLLDNVKDSLKDNNPFVVGDSSEKDVKSEMTKFLDQLSEVQAGRRLGVHLILDDPAGNSYLQNLYAPDDDPEMEITYYERNHEQNEDLGLNDMKTENYET